MTQPEISIVTGTYQRLESVMRMIRSIREHTPIPYEVILVDGGSKDGTTQWASAQPDVRLIEHGELKGAIKAFCDGANAALGRYALLLNDDVELMPGSLMAAFTYLETHPYCGQVAFMDDRPQLGRPAGQFRAQTMPATKDGQPVSVVYGQVALMPTDLGKQLGWWGADDPVMGKARTYGGDNYLSAKVWELGLSVDVVRGAMVRDYHHNDRLRTINENAHDKAYAQRYPEGPVIGGKPDIQTRERIRILYLPIYDPDAAEVQRKSRHGLRDALSRRGVVWEWDYLDLESGIHVEDITGFAPHIILTQFHDPRWKELIAHLKESSPDSLVINWNGDARGLVAPEYMDMLRLVDMQLVVNAAALSVYALEGIPAAYWQIGWEPRLPKLPKVEAFDVVFMGNCYSEQRRDMEKMLRTIPDIKVGLFGYGWQQGQGITLYDFTTGAALYAKAKIAISDTFSDNKTDVYAFASNRFFEALASGVFLLQQDSPGLDEWNGTQVGEHYESWTTLDDLREKIIRWLAEPPEKRKEIARLGQNFVRAHFSFDMQTYRLFEDILPRLSNDKPSGDD